jgi:hypothetical protein
MLDKHYFATNKYYLGILALVVIIISIAAYLEQAKITALIGIIFAALTLISKAKRKEKDFSNELKSHSKVVGELISKAFGTDSQLFGHCYYDKGELKRENPHSPSIPDVVLAEDHLQKGYSDIWQKSN